jgi:hypothetical protein
MRSFHRVVTLILFAACLTAQAKPHPAKIDASAIWQIPPQFMTNAHAACDQSPSVIAQCMIGQMTNAGAPSAAVSFSQELYKESHGEFGIMTDFQGQAPVAFAWIPILCVPTRTMVSCW